MADSEQPTEPARFEQTQWSLVLAAGAGEGSGAEFALAELCRTYWYPLYAFVRRRGTDHHDAEDLTQAFFGKLLEKNYLGDASRERGRFRTFLLASLKHFLANEWDRRQARKRGGGFVFVPLDAGAAGRFEAEAGQVAVGTAEEFFDRRWAGTVLERAMAELKASYHRDGRGEVFEALKPCLTEGAGAVRQTEVACVLGMEENAVNVAAHRLRQRYRKALRAEIARTVVDEGEVEEEFQHLRAVLARG